MNRAKTHFLNFAIGRTESLAGDKVADFRNRRSCTSAKRGEGCFKRCLFEADAPAKPVFANLQLFHAFPI
ncbi:MAG: hypothetical protein JWQ71_3740 [Pedosphaera sp.]|nr:hypothetical protein [Pedosphaera sp.]